MYCVPLKAATQTVRSASYSKPTIDSGVRIMSKRIIVIGAGFAGMWSALASARLLDEVGRTDV